jgi:hypothetical protein
MVARSLLFAAVATAALLAACSNDTGTLTDGTGGNGGGPLANAPGGGGAAGATASTPTSGSIADGTASGPLATNSAEGKAFYVASVHPILAATCGTCHSSAGPGPNWLNPADANASYGMLFSQGYVVQNSRLTTKGTHDGSTTNALNAAQIGTFNSWVTMELKDGGQSTTPAVLQKLGACFDQTLFNAMQMAQWKTTQRTNNNNTNKITPWNENANNCTGCNNTPCSACHSDDAATNFNDAEGNTILPAGTTFANTKLTTPAYITKFFGVSPDGKPIPSDGIKKKSDATMLGKAYSHPMFSLTTAQQTAVDAFVAGAIAKYNAGTCGP